MKIEKKIIVYLETMYIEIIFLSYLIIRYLVLIFILILFFYILHLIWFWECGQYFQNSNFNYIILFFICIIQKILP